MEYLESKLECLDGEEVQQIQDNINSLFHHCVQAMGEEHQIKVVNALQVCPAEEDRCDCPTWLLLRLYPGCISVTMEIILTQTRLAWSSVVVSDGQRPVLRLFRPVGGT